MDKGSGVGSARMQEFLGKGSCCIGLKIVELLVTATFQSIEASAWRRGRMSHIVATSFGIEHCHWVRSEDPGFVALAVDCLQTCGRRS